MKHVLIGQLVGWMTLASTGLAAQSQIASDDLEHQIAQLDAAVFAAFNGRDLDTFLGFFGRDLEFFHDQVGLTHYAELISSTERLFEADDGLHRELIAGSLEVHPIPGYGAIQIGRHEFCHWEGEIEDCGTFGFTHVWRNLEDTWQITRVLSYGH